VVTDASTRPAAFHAAYRVLSALFMPPADQRLATIVTAVPELRRILQPLRNLACGGPLDGLLTELEGFTDEDVERLVSDHTALFLSGSRDRAVQPYESWHVGVDAYRQPAESAELSACYREAGLAVGLAGEPPDHVAIELEFCAYLCHQEGDADDAGSRRRWQATRRGFLRDHPLRWIDSFERGLTASGPDSRYVGFARAARLVAGDDHMLVEAMLSDGAGRAG
jgi:TorA maturation chaperone TorD